MSADCRDLTLSAVEGSVEISRAVLDELVAHARAEAPNECCGVLIGTGRRIERAIRGRNTLESRTRYLLDPVDQIAAIKSARATGQTVLGFYHSHPHSSPTPSETDRAEAAYPGYCYLIVSPGSEVTAPEVRAFRLHDSGNFLPVQLVPTA